jgi:acetyl esterase/lipase
VSGFDRALTKTVNDVLRGQKVLKASEDNVTKEDIAEGLFARYRHWAERVVRTEVMNAYAVEPGAGIEEHNADLIAAVRSRLPPMLIFHGTADRVVPFANSRKFRRRNWWRRNLCRLRPFEGKGHGFFNFNVSVRVYELTLSEIDAFLVELGFIDPDPDAGLGREGVV